MNVKVTLEQLHRINKNKKVTNFSITESQITKLKNLIQENTHLVGRSSDYVDELTDQVTLKNLSDPTGVGIMIITKDTNDPDEPSLKSLLGKKKWETVSIEKEGTSKDYTIVNISNYVTKEEHENYDNVKSIDDLIIKLKNDPLFKQKEYRISKEEFKILETLKNKGEKIDRISVQIYYLLYRRSGTIKKFITKLNLFLPFMKMLLKKGEPLFSCIMEKLEIAIGNMDESLLKSFSDKKENFERLFEFFKNLKSCDSNLSVDIFSFFKTADYLKYEKEFVGTHFKHSPTSVSINLQLVQDFEDLNSDEFNQMINLDKMNTILKWVVKTSKEKQIKETELIKQIVENISISFPEIVKKDLEVIKPIYRKEDIQKLNPLLLPGDSVEVKFKNYEKPDFLCEFFKPESHNASMEFLVNELIVINEKYNSSFEVLKLIGILDTELVRKIIQSEIGSKLIESIKNNTKGIIFKDYVFVRMSDIDLTWTNVGYASKPRIAIKYQVKEGVKKFRLSIDNTDKEQINTIFYSEESFS